MSRISVSFGPVLDGNDRYVPHLWQMEKTADKEICKGCKHWNNICSKLIPIKRWYNQNHCEKEAEGKYDKYKYGNGNTEADGRGD